MGLDKLPKQFMNVGLRLPVVHKEKRLVLSIEADAKAGKTRLLFDLPKPLLVLRFDPNSELQEEVCVEADSEVYIWDIPVDDEVDRKKDLELFKRVRQMVFDACETGYFRGCALDTADHMWALAQRGFLGGTGFGVAPQSDFSVPNGAMTRIYNAVKAQRRMSFAETHRLRDGRETVENEKGKKASKLTGELVAAGWKSSSYEVQTVVRLEYDEDWKCDKSDCVGKGGCVKPELHGLNRYVATITKSQYSGRGTVLRGRNITFQNIGVAVFPSTEDDPEVWL